MIILYSVSHIAPSRAITWNASFIIAQDYFRLFQLYFIDSLFVYIKIAHMTFDNRRRL